MSPLSAKIGKMVEKHKFDWGKDYFAYYIKMNCWSRTRLIPEIETRLMSLEHHMKDERNHGCDTSNVTQIVEASTDQG